MMKNLLVISCLIVASVFVSSTRASLCGTLSPKTIGADPSETLLVNSWVNASIVLYATNPSFGAFFVSINDSSRAAHVSFYGSLIGCTELPAPTSGNMAADFDAYVELTREALKSVVDNMTVVEMTEFYQIFESFREYNSSKTICNQEGCQNPTIALALSGTASPLAFNKAYVATSAASLLVDNLSTEDAELYYVPATAENCAEKVLLESVAPGSSGQPLDLPFTASGVYYIFQVTAAEECFVNNTVFSNNVLVVDFTFVPVAPPVEAPVQAPVEAPVEAPVQAPVQAPETPVAPPVEPPVQAPVEAPVTAPVATPTTPIAQTPVEVPVAETPIEVPVATPVAVPVDNITPAAAEEGFSAGGYIAGIVILVLIVVGLVIAVIVMGVKLRRNSSVIVA